MDYGAGSGVLALVALASGAAEADGVEVDQMAIESAARNAALNEREESFTMWGPPLGATGSEIWDFDTGVVTETPVAQPLPPPTADNLYDVVVANILAPILIDLKDVLYSYAKDGASLVLSGVLVEQADHVVEEFTAAGWRDVNVKKTDSMGGMEWCLIVGRK